MDSWSSYVWRVEGQTIHEVIIWKWTGNDRENVQNRVRENFKLLGISDGEQLAMDSG